MVTIREARKTEAARIAELWAEMVDYHAPLDRYFTLREGAVESFTVHLQGSIDTEDTVIHVAEDGDELVGFCMSTLGKYPPVFVDSEYGFISDIAVTERCQRKGIGEKLCRRACEWLRSRGMSRIEVRVGAANPVSCSFWQKMGFKSYIYLMYREDS